MIGRLATSFAASKYVIYAQTRPCELATLDDAEPVGIDTFVDDEESPFVADKTFAFEAAYDEDDAAYLCAAAVDADRRVIAFGGTRGAPVTVEREPGEEYGRVHGASIALHPLIPARPIRSLALLHHAG